MRVQIQPHNKKPFCIALPNGLLMNRLTAAIACRKGASKKKRESAAKNKKEQDTPPLSSKQLYALFCEIKRLKKSLRKDDWKLVEVQAADGTSVTVRP